MLKNALRVILLVSFSTAALAAPTSAFPLVPGQVVQIAGDYGPSGLFTDTGFKVDTTTALTPVPGFPAEGYRVAVGSSGDLFVLTREPLPNESSRSVIWRVNPETGAATKLFGSWGAGDLTVVGSTPFVAPVNGDQLAVHYKAIDASLDGVVARLTNSFIFTINLVTPPFGLGFCTPCFQSPFTAEGFPGWGGDDTTGPGNSPLDIAWGYGHILYVLTQEEPRPIPPLRQASR